MRPAKPSTTALATSWRKTTLKPFVRFQLDVIVLNKLQAPRSDKYSDYGYNHVFNMIDV